MDDIEAEYLVSNYEQLRNERGWTAEQMASHLDPIDPALAALMREQADIDPTAAPEDRRAPAKPATTGADTKPE
jgi:hypothetical protein